MLEWLETCDSTSKVLKQRAKNGFSVPTALAAATQTAGAGRLGRSWISPKGNLHLSIAMPPGVLESHVLNILPIATGGLVAEWISVTFGLSICIKWPNDLFLDGKKIGGILCEATYEGSEFRGVIIGIGINLTAPPTLEELGAWDYLPGVLGLGPDARREPRDVAASLADYIIRELKTGDLQYILRLWQRFAIKPGHEWIKSKGESTVTHEAQADFDRRSDRGIDGDGQLRLEATSAPKERANIVLVNSVANEYTWALAKEGKTLVADVGNSVTKLAVAVNKEQIQIENLAAGTHDIKEFLNRFVGSEKPTVIHAISVNPEGMEQLKDLASHQGISVREVQRGPVGLLKSKYDLNAIGMDRFASIEAFLYLCRLNQGHYPALIVSLGTATTLDVIDANGSHLGGYIVPGLQASLDSLSARGRNLPKDLDISQAFKTNLQGDWPTASREAILHGATQMSLSFLRQERERLAKHCGVDVRDVQVHLTGGLSEAFKNIWPDTGVYFDPRLTLLGTAVLAFNGR